MLVIVQMSDYIGLFRANIAEYVMRKSKSW